MFGFKKAERKTNLLFRFGCSNVPGNPELEQNAVTGTHVRDKVPNTATSSQEWQKDTPCPRSKSGARERSGRIGKPVQGVEKPTCKDKVGLPHCADLSPTINTLRKSPRNFDRS